MAQSMQFSRILVATLLTGNLTAHASSLQFSHKQSGITYQGIGKFEQEAWGPYGLAFDEHGNALTYDAASARTISFGPNGRVFKQDSLSQTDAQLLNRFNASASLATYEFAPMKSNSAKVFVGNTSLVISGHHILGGLKYLGTTPAGDILIQVTEVLPSHVVQIDQTVHKFDSNGNWLAVARVPVSERFIPIEHATAMHLSGKVFTLVPHQNSIELRELSFSNQPLAPLPFAVSDFNEQPSVPTACTMTRADMVERANEIVGLQVQLSVANVNGIFNGQRCSGRQIPRYIKGSGAYSGIPYDWGGFDGVPEFLEAMQQGRAAGDVDTANVEACSYGLDCSGFVSRVWRQTKKYGTFTLHEISGVVGVKAMLTGDVFNLSGSHVILFERFTNNGIQGWESTKYKALDRSVYIESTWDRIAGYQPRRYKSVCE